MEEAAKQFAPMIQSMFKTIGALNKAFYEKYGKEALPTITKAASEEGVERGKIMQGML